MAAENGSAEYHCATQDGLQPTLGVAPVRNLKNKGTSSTGVQSLVLGMADIVPRWDVATSNELQLLYSVRVDTFRTATEASLSARQFQEAANQWNELQTGLSIIPTNDQKSANFYLRYSASPPDPDVLAMAFFPHEVGQDVVVFPLAFNPRYANQQTPIFAHELGHVLGLRHEFATTGEAHLDIPAEANSGAVQFMETNDSSIMNYHWPMEIQQTDRDGVKAFYELPNGTEIAGQPITDYLPQVRKRIRKRDRNGNFLRTPQAAQV